MDLSLASNQLVCIEYPAIVKNVDLMLQTLGGEKAISEVYNDPNGRMNLKFRPNDVYCKSLHGESISSTNLLLRVVCRRRKKPKPSDVSLADQNQDSKIIKIEVVGNIKQSYRFKTLCDYQYLPIEQREAGRYESLLPSIVPTGLLPSSWLKEECPLLIVPPLFSRMENPSNYHFGKSLNSLDSESQDPNIIGRARSRRSGYGIFINSEDPTPTKPSATPAKILKAVINHKKELLDNLKKAFEARPIWSSNAIMIVVKSDKGQLKHVLPAYGYYFLTGPWRGLWVRFGYDPRKTPEAKIYQLLDIRIRVPPGINLSFLDMRRSGQMKLTNKMHYTRPTVSIIETQKLPQTTPLEEEAGEESSSKTTDDMELRYKFKEGHLPKYKQMFYQLCDIEMDSVINLIAASKGLEVYHERDGWLSLGTLEKCRQLILADVNKSLTIIKKAQLDEGAKPSSDIVTDDEDLLSDSDYEDDEMDVNFE